MRPIEEQYAARRPLRVAEGRTFMRSYDDPREYRMALGFHVSRRAGAVAPQSGGSGMSPVTLSAHLMAAIERGRSRHSRNDDDDDQRAA